MQQRVGRQIVQTERVHLEHRAPRVTETENEGGLVSLGGWEENTGCRRFGVRYHTCTQFAEHVVIERVMIDSGCSSLLLPLLPGALQELLQRVRAFYRECFVRSIVALTVYYNILTIVHGFLPPHANGP